MLLPEPKTGSSCPSSSKHIPCPGKILSRWWLFEGAWDYLCFAGGDLGTEAAQLAQALAKWLRSLSPALTWGLAKLEHFSMRTAMWPQLQAQRLSFTSWIAYNNGMLGYLGCVHCRGCFLFKNKTKQNKKKKEKGLFPTKISNHGRIGIWTCSVLWLLTISLHSTAHFWLLQCAGINGCHGSGALWLLSPSLDDAHLAASAASQPVGTEPLLVSSCWDLSWMLCKVF